MKPEVDSGHNALFKKRKNLVDQTLFQLPFSHPRDMKLYYKKYGLSLRGVAPFFDPDPFDCTNGYEDLDKLIKMSSDATKAMEIGASSF